MCNSFATIHCYLPGLHCFGLESAKWNVFAPLFQLHFLIRSFVFSFFFFFSSRCPTEIPGPNRNKNPLNGGGKGGGAGGSLDADANDILKQKQQVKVTYQPEDEELQYGSVEDFEAEGGEGGGLTPLSPHVYYTSGNKPATHKPGNSGGNQHLHQQHHHHHHHNNNNNNQQHSGGPGGGPTGGESGSLGGEMGGITRKPPPYYGGNTEVRGPIDNNEMSSGSGDSRLCRGHHLPILLLPFARLILVRSWHCRHTFLMGLSQACLPGLLLSLL